MAIDTLKQPSLNGTTKIGTLGLVAGDGKLPGILARCAKDKGYKIISLALSEGAKARVAPHSDKVYMIAPGQLGRNTHIMKSENVDFMVFIGKIPKLNILKNIHKFDWTAIREVSRFPDFSDDTIQRGMGDWVEKNGIKVLTQTEFLCDLFPEYGIMTSRKPTVGEYADVEYGMRIAKETARLGIGQTVIVKNQMIMAVEAIEGTDESIKRAVSLANGPVVVCKVAKFDQDPRFDTPTVGLNTLESMVCEKGGGVLAVGAGETLVVERDEMVAFAEQHGIAMIAV